MGLATISWVIISRNSSRLSARTLTICTRPGVRICFWATLRCSLGWSQLIALVQSKRMSQVDAPHFRVFAQFRGRPGTEDAAALQDVCTVGHGQRFTNIMI